MLFDFLVNCNHDVEILELKPFFSIPLNDCLIAWSLDADCLKILSPDFKFLGSVECPSSVKSVIYNDSTDELLTGGLGESSFQTYSSSPELNTDVALCEV
jgi:hypothetical protein